MVVALQLVGLAQVPQEGNEVPLLQTVLIVSSVLLCGRLLHLQEVRADLLAGALTTGAVQTLYRPVNIGDGSLHVTAHSTSKVRLLPGSSDEVLIDVLNLLLVAVLDRCADGEGLDNGITDDVRLVEEACVAADHAATSAGAVRILTCGLVLLLGVPEGAGRSASWLAADHEVLGGGWSRTAAKMELSSIG